jgi:hypothetical protein
MTQTLRHVFTVLPIACLLVAAPLALGSGKFLSYDAAHADKGGNGNGKGGGIGGGSDGAGGKAGGQSASNDGQGKNGKGGVAKQLGALNAAHASAKAFENASLKSRVGRIGTYKAAAEAAIAANDVAAAAIATAIANNPAALQAIADSETADLELQAARDALANATTDQEVQDATVALEAAVNKAEAAQLAETAAKDAAIAADPVAQEALQKAEDAAKAEMEALTAAANKDTPLSPEAQGALDALLAGK